MLKNIKKNLYFINIPLYKYGLIYILKIWTWEGTVYVPVFETIY